MEQVVPWKGLLVLIEPHQPKTGAPARQPYRLETMLRICRLPVNLIQAFLEVSGQTSPKETTDAQEQVHRESDRYDVEAG